MEPMNPHPEAAMNDERVAEKPVTCYVCGDVVTRTNTLGGAPMCQNCYAVWYDGGGTDWDSLRVEVKRRERAGLFPFRYSPAQRPLTATAPDPEPMPTASSTSSLVPPWMSRTSVATPPSELTRTPEPGV